MYKMLKIFQFATVFNKKKSKTLFILLFYWKSMNSLPKSFSEIQKFGSRLTTAFRINKMAPTDR